MARFWGLATAAAHVAAVPPDQRRRSEPCKVIRPARPGDPPAEDDTDENPPAPSAAEISVSRTRTPADEKLAEIIGSLKKRDDVALPEEFYLALDRISQIGAEDRTALEKQLQAHVAAAAARNAQRTRWQRFARVIRGVGVGAVVGALAVVARVLIAHGDAGAVSRQQAATVERHSAAIVQLQTDQSTIRAQAAADHALISIFAARLSAGPLAP